MRKAIMLLSDDDTLKAIVTELREHEEMYEQKLEFLKKQAKSAAHEFDKLNKKHFALIEDRLEELGKLPKEYDRDNDRHSVTFSVDENLVAWEIREDEVCTSCGDRHPTALHGLPSGLVSILMGMRERE